MIYSAYFAFSILLASNFLVAATDVLAVAEQAQEETLVASEHAIALEYKAIVIGERQAIKLPLRDPKKHFGNLEALQVACFQDSEMPTLRAMVQGLIYKANNLLPQNKQVKMPKLVFFIKKSTADNAGEVDLALPNAGALWLTDSFNFIGIGGFVLTQLDMDEIEMVLAHELAHIVKAHSVKKLAAATIEHVANPFYLPNAATLIARWYDRSNEYAADAYANKLVSKPEKLVSGLEKIKKSVGGVPVSKLWESIAELFSTHPSNQHRKEALGVLN